MAVKFKNLPITEFQVKFADDNSAEIEGYGSTFGNMDSYRDIVVAGAFKDSIAQKVPAMLYQHRTDRICGIWNAVSEDSKGLLLRGNTIKTTLGRDTAEELRSGALKTMSIGYRTLDDSYDKTNNVCYLKKLELYEVSLVTFPANDKAVITGVKGAMEDIDAAGDLIDQAASMMASIVDGTMQPSPELLATIMQALQGASGFLEDPQMDDGEKGKPTTEREFEKYLRDAGFSRTEAKKIAAGGYKAVVTQRDAGEGIDTLINLLNKF